MQSPPVIQGQLYQFDYTFRSPYVSQRVHCIPFIHLSKQFDKCGTLLARHSNYRRANPNDWIQRPNLCMCVSEHHVIFTRFQRLCRNFYIPCNTYTGLQRIRTCIRRHKRTHPTRHGRCSALARQTTTCAYARSNPCLSPSKVSTSTAIVFGFNRQA